MLGSLKKSMIAGSALAAALLIVTPSANAASFTFTGTNAGGTLSASAVITTNAGSITVVLTNTLAANAIQAQNQAVSDLSFTTSNAVGTVGALTASGQQGNVSTTGVVTYVAGSPCRFIESCGTVPPNGTGDFSASGTSVLLEAIGGGQPSQMILPFIANGGTYTNALTGGFDNFNPYTIGPATFTLQLSGITAATTISGVNFSFGTGPDTFIPGTGGGSGGGAGAGGGSGGGQTVPEPATLTLIGLGMLGAAYRARRQAA